MFEQQRETCREYEDFLDDLRELQSEGMGDVLDTSGFDNFDVSTATAQQKGNFGEYLADDNLLNNQAIKDKGYDLKSIGREVPTSIDAPTVHGIDGLYENINTGSSTKYIIDEAKFGSSKLSNTLDGLQMSDDWLLGNITGNNRILDAVNGDEKLAEQIIDALGNGEIEKILSKIDANGVVKTFLLDVAGKVIGPWP